MANIRHLFQPEYTEYRFNHANDNNICIRDTEFVRIFFYFSSFVAMMYDDVLV